MVENATSSSKNLPNSKISCVMGLEATMREREWGYLLDWG